MTDPDESRLGQAIRPVLEAIAARDLSHREQVLLAEILLDHGLEGPSPPAWMLTLCEVILTGQAGLTRQRPWSVPLDYPFGLSGLINLLGDIHAQFLALGIEDMGEAVNWPLPACGVTVCVSRESSSPGCARLEILPYPERMPDALPPPAVVPEMVGPDTETDTVC